LSKSDTARASRVPEGVKAGHRLDPVPQAGRGPDPVPMAGNVSARPGLHIAPIITREARTSPTAGATHWGGNRNKQAFFQRRVAVTSLVPQRPPQHLITR